MEASTRHIVLGLLNQRPGYGYDIAARLRARFQLPVSGIYGLLDRLEDDGLIAETGDRDHRAPRRGATRVMYEMTDAGRARFHEWLHAPLPRRALRDELATRLHLAQPDDLPHLLDLAEQELAACVRELAENRRPTLVAPGEAMPPWGLAASLLSEDLRVTLLQAQAKWLERVCIVLEERVRAGS